MLSTNSTHTKPTKAFLCCSYAIVAAYGLADTLDRGIKAQNKLKNSQPACRAAPPRPHHPRKLLAAIPPPGPLPPLNPVAATMAESLIWHTAASLIIPGVIINR